MDGLGYILYQGQGLVMTAFTILRYLAIVDPLFPSLH